MAHQLRSFLFRSSGNSRTSVSRIFLSLFAFGLFAVCGLSSHAQAPFYGVPPVVVSSVSPVPVPTPPFPAGSSAYGTQSGDLTPVYSPTSLALDACGNIYTVDKGSDTGTAPGNTGDTVTEIPANGGYASIVVNVGGYYNVPLGQDPTYHNLLVGQQYSGANSLGLIPLTKCVPNVSQETVTGAGNGPLFYFYNIAASGADFAGNYYLSTNLTCCVANSYYLVQESSGNILLTNPGTPSLGTYYAYNDLTVDRNQNIYYIEPALTGEVSELPFSGGTYAAAPVQFGGTYVDPVGLSVDAQSNLYVVDEGNASIYEIPFEANRRGVGALNPAHQFTITSGLSAAPDVSVAVNARGDIYFTTEGATSVSKLTQGGANFGKVPVGQTATATLNFQFNSPATIELILLPEGVFAAGPGGSGSCTRGVKYGPASTENHCTIAVTFTPKELGKQLGAVALIDETHKEPFVIAYLEGTGR